MGRLRELINIFINPIPPERSLDELAVEAGISEEDLKALKLAMNAGDNWKSADELEDSKKGKSKKSTTVKETQMQHQPKSVVKDLDTEISDERE